MRALLTMLGCTAALVLVATGCGGDDEASGGGVITADGSSTVGPFTTKAAEDWKASGGGDVTVGISAPVAASSASASARPTSPTRRAQIDEDEVAICEENDIEYVELQVATDALTNVVNTANDWATCLTVEQLNADLGARLEGDELEAGRPLLPGRRAQALRSGHRLGHVRLLHRRDQRRGGREPHRLLRQRGRQRHRAGRLGRRGRSRLLRLLLLRGEPGHAEGARGRRRRRLRRAERRDRPGRVVRAARAPALHVREAELLRTARTSTSSSATRSRTQRRSPRRRSSSRSPGRRSTSSCRSSRMRPRR